MNSFQNDDERWAAVVARDQNADGHFYFAVASTGVYCRPSCAARQALRKNVSFFDTAQQAAKAGFRPCRRCRPGEASAEERKAATIARTCRQIDEAEEFPGLDALAETAGMSRFHFGHVFKEVTGVTPRLYFQNRRAHRVQHELKKTATVTEAIYSSGYQSNGRFYAQTGRTLGMTPRAYRAGGQGNTIRFALGECSLGSVLVAATTKGICAVSLGDDPERLLRELQTDFPKANLVGADNEFETWVAQVVALVERPQGGMHLPLDVQGTAFQSRVWEALRQIPVGATATYGEIAAQVGEPSAVRAVAQACASNRLAVAIPCHRVVRKDGALSGYRWGVERKQALLDREVEKRAAPSC